MDFRKMVNRVLQTLILFVFLIGVPGCASNPYTNRSQFLLIPESQEVEMGNQAYAQALNDPDVVISKNPAEVDPVKRVAERIIAAAKQSKYAERAKSFEWEVTVIKDDKTKNAWALPGGKIAVYTGIFPEARNENGLAAIMGHEVVHALARHGAERVSQNNAANFGVQLAFSALNLDVAPMAQSLAQSLAMQAVGIGILLPFSRGHESEADYIGLLLAADAGYDPREATGLWERMAESSKGSPPEFLSTHPSHDTRIQDLRKWMPEAMARYERASKAPNSTLPSIN